jgi:ferritin-like metal-binding protein YciE
MAKGTTKTRKTSKSTSNKSRSQSKGSNMSDNPLHEAFMDEIADIYNAEQQLIKALPRMAKAAHAPKLRTAFESHLAETKQQAQRIKDVMKTVSGKMKSKRCKAMEGLIEEGEEMIKEFRKQPSLDAVLIAAAQKVEHYEIAAYGTICAWAEQMGHEEALEPLRENLEEEKAADEKLTQIAESLANSEATKRRPQEGWET